MGNRFIQLLRTFPRGDLRCSRLLPAALLVLGPLAVVRPVAAQTVEDVVRRNEPAAVVIIGQRPGAGDVQGSGCFVSGSGVILTSLHQVQGLQNLQIITSTGGRQPASLLASESACDLALLKAEGAVPASVSVGDATALKNGAPLIAITAPENLQFSTVTGVVSNSNRTYKGMRVIQADLPADPGSSGAPVFDKEGALVGIIIGRLGNQQWVTVINPVNNAYNLLKANGVSAGKEQLSDLMLDEGEIVPSPGATPLERQAIEVYNRGVAANSPAEKVEAYRRAVKLLPGFYEAWFNLGVAGSASDQTALAIAAYRKAERLRPDAVEVQHNLGRVFLWASQPQEAAACFRRALALAPGCASAHNDLGEALRRMGKMEEAEKAFSAAIAADPKYAPALYNLALVCSAAGRRGEAAGHLRAYLVALPNAADAAQVTQWLRELEGGASQ